MIHEYPKIEKILDSWEKHALRMQAKNHDNNSQWNYYLGMEMTIRCIRKDILKLVNKEAEEMEAYFRPLSDIMVGS